MHRRLVQLRRSGRRYVGIQDLRSVVRGKIEKLEQDLKSKREDLTQLEARREVLETFGLALRVPASVPGMSKGASAGPSTP